MASVTTDWTASVQARDARTFTGIFALSFSVLLCVALVSQLLTCQWRTWLPGAESEKSMIGGVRAAVYTFMSHLN
jgi:light-harvesting complex 1 beta chain